MLVGLQDGRKAALLFVGSRLSVSWAADLICVPLTASRGALSDDANVCYQITVFFVTVIVLYRDSEGTVYC